jgi:two-component system sensor histidine kinase BaeS
LLSYIPLVILPIIVIGLVTRSATEYSLTVLVTGEGGRIANNLAARFGAYYMQNGSWSAVDSAFTDIVASAFPNRQQQPRNNPPDLNPELPGPPGNRDGLPPGATPTVFNPGQAAPDQVILADTKGVILASNDSKIIGQTLAADTLARGTPIMARGRTVVGVIVIGAALGALDSSQKQILDSVNNALVISGVLSAILFFGLGLWTSGQITAPISDLMHGVMSFRLGKRVPVPIHGNNELGDLSRAFNEMAEDVERQQMLRKQMIADIAHDLRTPLSVLTLEIEGIKQGFQSSEEAVDSLSDEVNWLTHLVDDLHTLSLIDSNQLDVHVEETNLALFLESVYRHWRTPAAAQGRPFSLEIPDPDLPLVRLDASRMRQVLGNLINNAFQHTPMDATVTLTAAAHDGFVTIAVADKGQGIPPDALPRLFERFYRADKSRGRKKVQGSSKHGSGLGLTIAYRLTELQGGKLSVQSTVGQGTTFQIELVAELGGALSAHKHTHHRAPSLGSA